MTPTLKTEHNLEHMLDVIAHSDTDYIVFPEMSLTGWLGDFSEKALRAAWDRLVGACRQSYTTAIVGTGAREAGALYIQSRVISHEGNLLGVQNKLIPTQEDRAFCEPGGELEVFEHHGLRFGCLIGNDFWVAPGGGPWPDPRLSYQLGKKGANVIFLSARTGTDKQYKAFFESNLALRAREAGLYICVANAADAAGPLNCPSGVISPEGQWIESCSRTGDHTFTVDLDLDLDEEEE
jgi:predicted amidohydrolase